MTTLLEHSDLIAGLLIGVLWASTLFALFIARHPP